MTPNGAARERANNAVMAGKVTGRSTDQRALDTPFRMRRRACANYEQHQRKSGQHSGHLILSAVLLFVGRRDNTSPTASFREKLVGW
jgi:hypothetical protein